MHNKLTHFIDTHPIGRIFRLGTKKAVWKKVNELTTGMQIAIEENGKLDWDEIVSIVPVGSEQVWDIEVSNTHNFVGNGILAHNTYIGGSADFIGGTSTGTLTFSGVTTDITTAGNEHLVLSPGGTGNIGIGTTGPAATLEVVADSATYGQLYIRPSSQDKSGAISLQSTQGTDRVWTMLAGNNATNQNFRIYDGSNNRLEIDPVNALVIIDGQLTIGTNPAASGHIRLPNNSSIVGRNGANTGDISLITINTSNELLVGTTMNMSAQAINNAYSLAIGMTSASVALDVTGNIEYTGTITDVSDVRLKENFDSITNPLTKILTLNSYRFNMIGQSADKVELGYKAQDVQLIIPELVSIVDPENGYLGVNYIGFIPLITEAIKEQQAMINTLAISGELTIISTGEVAIAGETNNYQVTKINDGTIITKIAVLAEAVIGKLSAGLITTRDLVVSQSATIADLSVTSLKIGGQSIQTYVEQIVQATLQNNNITPSQTLVSPIANIETFTAQTATVSGSTTTESLTVSGTTKLGALVAEKIETPTLIAGEITATSARVAALEAGMAELQSVRAQTAEIVDATISGTLYANNIYGFEEKLATSLREPTLLETLIGQQTGAANTSDMIATLEQAGFQATPSAALQATLADLQLGEGDVVLTSAALFVDQYFSVNGTGFIADSLGVGNKLFVGDGLEFSDGIIAYNPTAVEHPTLYVQPSGKGSLSLLAGLMILSEDGTVAINGDLTVAGKVKTDTLLSNLLQPADFGNPFQVQVAGISTESGQVKESRFEIINELGTPVATISAQGKANFAGGIGVGSDASSTSSGEITTDKTSGKAVVQAGSDQLIIRSSVLTPDSLVYVTPVGSTGNNVLYVKSQQLDQFVVGFDSTTDIDVPFNWWVVN